MAANSRTGPTPILIGLALRQAEPSDAAMAAPLIYAAWGTFSHYMFCMPDESRTTALMAALFATRGNRFSFEYATVAHAGRDVAGLLLAIPGHRLLGQTRQLVAAVARCAGAATALAFALRWSPFLLRPEAAPGELYLDTVSVAPAWRGRGLGTFLLSEADRQARQGRLEACSLSVDIDNPQAQRLYERLGYRVAATHVPARYARAAGYAGYHHMVKTLPSLPL